MFTSIPPRDNSGELEVTPERNTLSFNDAKKLAYLLETKLRLFKRDVKFEVVGITKNFQAPKDQEWLERNVLDHNKLYVFQVRDISTGYKGVARWLANTYMVSPRECFEQVLQDMGVSRDELDTWYYNLPSVQKAIDEVWK
jgi:hypothetical protein